MKLPLLRVCVGAILVLTGLPVLGQALDVLGTWDMSMQVTFTGLNESCEYSGTATITSQIGGTIEGMSELDLVAGPPQCPSMMTAALNGSWDGDVLYGTLDGGEAYGVASFQGTTANLPVTRARPTVPTKAIPGTTYAGPFTVTSGPYTSVVNGTWSAVARGAAVLAIPVLGPLGSTSLILLLLVGGAWLLARWRLV